MTASDRITAGGWRIVLLASLGGTLEFYDFVIFGVFAGTALLSIVIVLLIRPQNKP